MSAHAREVAELMREHCGGNRRLAMTRVDVRASAAFAAHNVVLFDAVELLERARSIKSPEEILCMNVAIGVAEVGMARMRGALRLGMTEASLWSILHQTNISMGGEWIDCRLLAAGDRAVPWMQETSLRMIRPCELVAFDTDVVGPLGYAADISRTFHSGPGRPKASQRHVYRLAPRPVYCCDDASITAQSPCGLRRNGVVVLDLTPARRAPGEHLGIDVHHYLVAVGTECRSLAPLEHPLGHPRQRVGPAYGVRGTARIRLTRDVGREVLYGLRGRCPAGGSIPSGDVPRGTWAPSPRPTPENARAAPTCRRRRPVRQLPVSMLGIGALGLLRALGLAVQAHELLHVLGGAVQPDIDEVGLVLHGGDAGQRPQFGVPVVHAHPRDRGPLAGLARRRGQGVLSRRKRRVRGAVQLSHRAGLFLVQIRVFGKTWSLESTQRPAIPHVRGVPAESRDRAGPKLPRATLFCL